jgi:hypothetical protein
MGAVPIGLRYPEHSHRRRGKVLVSVEALLRDLLKLWIAGRVQVQLHLGEKLGPVGREGAETFYLGAELIAVEAALPQVFCDLFDPADLLVDIQPEPLSV